MMMALLGKHYTNYFSRPLFSRAWRPLLGLILGLLTLAICIPSYADNLPDALDQVPGTRIEVRPADLPRPYETGSVSNSASRVSRPDGAVLRVPSGFTARLFAEGLDHARWLMVAANGDVFLAEPRAGRVTLLRDADGDGRAELRKTFLDGLDDPHGMAVSGGFFHVADSRGVWRVPYTPGDTRPRAVAVRITAPGAFGDSGGHWTRNLAFSRDGRRFYVAIGSESNIAVEAAPRATVQEFNADGSGQKTFADGLRNPVGIAFYPGSDDLYVAVNERDGLGDGLVPDYLTRLSRGGFYGWPYSYIGPNPQPGYGDRRPDLVARAIVPDVLFRAHSAPLGLVFYEGAQFPAAYRGDAFVALHGSWNAARPRGYFVARVPFENGRPKGTYEIFASGFWRDTDRRDGNAYVMGRPAGLAVARDGALLIADDAGSAIWRVAYGR